MAAMSDCARKTGALENRCGRVLMNCEQKSRSPASRFNAAHSESRSSVMQKHSLLRRSGTLTALELGFINFIQPILAIRRLFQLRTEPPGAASSPSRSAPVVSASLVALHSDYDSLGWLG